MATQGLLRADATCPMQEASEAGVLGKPQFKTLSCGLALAGFAHILCLHPYWCALSLV